MNMTINLNITATELCEAINNLAGALVGASTIGAVDQQPATTSTRKPRATKQAEVATTPEPVAEVETLPEAEVLEKVAESLKSEEVVQPEPTKEAPKLTLEEVRGKLATLSAAGHAPKIKELFATFGAKKLTEVPEDKYSELMIAAEAIG